jgi:hypothetical protein
MEDYLPDGNRWQVSFLAEKIFDYFLSMEQGFTTF